MTEQFNNDNGQESKKNTEQQTTPLSNRTYNNPFGQQYTYNSPPLGQNTNRSVGQQYVVPQTQYYTYIPYGFTPETHNKKREIRKSAIPIGLGILIMLGISFFWATIFYFVMSKMGYTATQAYKIISEPAVLQCVQIVLSTLMFTIPFIIIMKVNGQRISDLVPLGKPEKNLSLPFFFFGIAFCAFANIAVSQAGAIFESFGIHYSVDGGEYPKGIFGFLLALISTAVVPPLVEEFACRGLIMGSLRKFGDGFAMVTSAIIFGLMHGNFEQIPFAFLVGLVLAYIVIKTGSLWIACAVHCFNNLISVIFQYLLSDISVMAQNVSYAILLTVCLLFGIIGIYLIKGDKKDVYVISNCDTVCTEKQKYKWFFTSPLIIIFAVICLIESLLFF